MKLLGIGDRIIMVQDLCSGSNTVCIGLTGTAISFNSDRTVGVKFDNGTTYPVPFEYMEKI